MDFLKNRRPTRLAACCVALATAWLLGPSRALAQSAPATTEPVVVVTLGSISKLTQDINYVTSAVGQPQAGAMFTVMSGAFTEGLDPTLPIGVVVPLVNGTPEPIGLVPTPDVKKTLKRLEAQTGPADILDDGTIVLVVGANNVYIKQVGNWAVIARNRELLAYAPADPMAVIGELGKEYDLAVNLRMQQVPVQVREMLVNQLRQGFEQAMAQQGNDSDAARQAAENSIEQLEMLIQETDQLRVGLDIDPSAKEVGLDLAFTAVPGSTLAAMYGEQVSIPSKFASVIRPEAAAFYHAATSISPASIEQAKKGLENSLLTIRTMIANEGGLSESQQADVNAMVDRIAELAIDSIAEGKADTGAVLLAGPDELRLAFGAFVSDGNEAAAIVKELAAKVANEPDAPTFRFDVGNHNGAQLHVVEADVPQSADEARKVFGETLTVHIATAPQAVYLALGAEGDDSKQLMLEMIDASAKDLGGNRPLGQLYVKLLPILQFAQSIQQNEAVAAMIDTLQRSPDSGVMSVSTNNIPSGQDSRVTLGEGLLQAIGAAIRQSQMQNQPQF